MTRDRLIEQLLDVIEDEATAQQPKAPAAQPSILSRYLTADHQAARTIGELKEILRTTADLLEMEAVHLRQELERLERVTGSSVCH